jgi:hypothetical protein
MRSMTCSLHARMAVACPGVSESKKWRRMLPACPEMALWMTRRPLAE